MSPQSPRVHRRDVLRAAGLLTLGAFVPVRAEEPLPAQARAALARATAAMRAIAAEGGYLWWYSPDLKERAGEVKATPTQIWVQPPGTPSMGMGFLRAYAVTKDSTYLQAAREAASALARGQLESGGWDYVIDFDPEQGKKWYRRADRGRIEGAEAAKRKNVSTYDDDNSQSALRFLLAFLDAAPAGEPGLDAIRAARDYGLAKLLEAQYPNGAWPQRWDGRPHDAATHPVQKARIPATYPREWPHESYYGHYTLNDNTQRDCIRTLVEAAHRLKKPEYLAAAKRGGDFLLLAQLPAPQAAWAQQYNAQMEPAWARAFEPPSVCSSESVGVIRTLVELFRETGDRRYLETLPAAIEWFRKSEIAPGRWARMYELGTNRPVYGDRDGKIHSTLGELSEERRTGYAWQGSYGVAEAIRLYEAAAKSGPGKPAPRPEGTRPGKDRLPELEAAARSAIAALDADGRWLERGRIQTRTFLRNLDTLCDYLEAAGG